MRCVAGQRVQGKTLPRTLKNGLLYGPNLPFSAPGKVVSSQRGKTENRPVFAPYTVKASKTQ
jgi:hypothetical protein